MRGQYFRTVGGEKYNFGGEGGTNIQTPAYIIVKLRTNEAVITSQLCTVHVLYNIPTPSSYCSLSSRASECTQQK